ncbi:MAG: FkbM family methyltransferase [Rhodospirillaceae bacterium]|nr:FkbM family methyltransferase [Rhodospirillaceae bacterium]
MPSPFSFFDVFPETRVIETVDVGARPMEGIKEVYTPLNDRRKTRITAFEPDVASCDNLQKSLGAPHRCFPYIIGDGSAAVFHETSTPATSSLYPPNGPVLDLFLDIAPHVQLKQCRHTQTKRLDDIKEIERIDFLKIDVQGAELDVLKGAIRLMPNILVVHTEVEFMPLYSGQPLFSDIDIFLRGQGFQFHTFASLSSHFVRPVRGKHGGGEGSNQILWGDAVYIRDLLSLSGLTPDQQIQFAAILHELYGSVDVSMYILESLVGRGHKIDMPEYWRRLRAKTSGS